MNARVFLSFCHDHDAGYAGRLAGHLAGAGLPAAYDTQSMSESWWATYTQRQIDACSAVVAVMTAQAERSGWVAREIAYAKQLQKPVIELRTANTTLDGMPDPGFLQQLRAALGVPAPSVNGPQVPTSGGRLDASVGIETRGGVFTPIIQRGAVVPYSRTEVFTTAEDNQPSIKITLFAGNAQLVKDNQRLGQYDLLLPPGAPAGVPAIKVTFAIDAAGGFQLLAEDGTGEPIQVRIA